MMSSIILSWDAEIEISLALGLQLCEVYKYEQISLPGNSHMKTFHNANPRFWRALAMNPFYKILTDADAEMLMGDEAKRQLYAD